jgi:hypothetical protein
MVAFWMKDPKAPPFPFPTTTTPSPPSQSRVAESGSVGRNVKTTAAAGGGSSGVNGIEDPQWPKDFTAPFKEEEEEEEEEEALAASSSTGADGGKGGSHHGEKKRRGRKGGGGGGGRVKTTQQKEEENGEEAKDEEGSPVVFDVGGGLQVRSAPVHTVPRMWEPFSVDDGEAEAEAEGVRSGAGGAEKSNKTKRKFQEGKGGKQKVSEGGDEEPPLQLLDLLSDRCFTNFGALNSGLVLAQDCSLNCGGSCASCRARAAAAAAVAASSS